MRFSKYITSGVVIFHLSINSVNASASDVTGLVRYYIGDSTLEDSSESGISLVAQNGQARYENLETTPFSKESRAVFQLNGSSGNGYHLRASTSGLPLNNSARTVMGWARINQLSGSGELVHIFAYGADSSGAVFSFGCRSDGKLYFDTRGSSIILIPDYRPLFNTWHHYAITYDSPTVKFYVDGILTKQGSVSLNTQNGNLWIGSNYHCCHTRGSTFYGAAAEIAVFNRALTVEEINTFVATASGGGDPHFLAFGGIAFTWQGHCDVILMKSHHSDPEKNIEIHIRTRKIRKWSAIDMLAFKTGQSVVEIESDEGTLIHNGIEMKSINRDSLKVAKSLSTLTRKIMVYNIVFNQDKRLEVKVNTRSKMIYVAFSGNYPLETVGLLGSPHNPGLFTRNGTHMTAKDINEYVESWQTRDSDPKLFQQDRSPKYPEKCIYEMSDVIKNTPSRRLKAKHTVTRYEAVAACAGHKPGLLKDYCIEDVIATADLEVAKDEFYG